MDAVMQNKIIDIDYFIANQNEIEKIKNKKFSSAVSTLLKFQSGNYLLYDGNTQRITNITQNTAVFFNQALIKDIAKSYDMLEDACSVIADSDYRDMLADNPILFGKEAKFVHIYEEHDDGVRDEFYIVNTETEEFFKEFPLDYFDGDDKFSTFDFYKASGYSTKKETGYEFNVLSSSFSKRNKQIGRAGFFTDKADGIVEVLKDGENKDVLLRHAFSFGKKNTRHTRDKSKTRLDLTFKLDFLQESTRKLTGLDMELFTKLTKKAEMFTFGYLTNKDDYISRKTARYIYSSNNPEYDKSAKSGRESIDNINKDYQSVLNLLQYAVDTNMNTSSLYDKLSTLPLSSVYVKNSISSIAENAPHDLDSIELNKEVAKINIFLNGLLETLNKIDEIDLDSLGENHQLRQEMENIQHFSSKKKVLDKSIEIFNSIQFNATVGHDSDIDIDRINEIIKSFTVRTRAGVLDVKVDSYILNMRDGAFEMNDALQELYDSDPIISASINNLKNNKYYDFFEFDKDYLDGTISTEDKATNRKKFLEFSHAINELDMPVSEKSAFKIRKLGNYKASGIYFSGVNTIAVDCRFGNHFASAKHEEVHRIDISSQLNKYGRYSLVNDLSHYFSPRVKDLDKSDYYLKDVELIARAGEIASLLYEGNYEKHLSLFRNGGITEDELWDNVKMDFENSKTKTLMKSFDAYSQSSVYIDFQKATQHGSDEEKLINTILEYYRPFFSKEMTDVMKLKSSYSSGNEDRTIEGIKTENFDKIYLDPNEKKLIEPQSVTLNNFDTFSVNFDTLGTKEIVSIVDEVKKNGTVAPSVLKEQLDNGIVSLDELYADKDVFYNLVSDTNLKSVLSSHSEYSSREHKMMKGLTLHFLETEPEKSLFLLIDNPFLQNSSAYSADGTLFDALMDKDLANREILLIEISKSFESPFRLKNSLETLDYSSSSYGTILTNGIKSIFHRRFTDDDLLLVNAIYNDVEFLQSDIERIKEIIPDFDRFSYGFLKNNYRKSFDLPSFSEKLEKFLQSASIEYSFNDIIQKVYMDWGVNKDGLAPLSKEEALSFVSSLMEFSRESIRDEVLDIHAKEEARSNTFFDLDADEIESLIDKRISRIGNSKMRDYIEFLQATTLKDSSNAELFKLTSTLVPNEFLKSFDSDYLCRTLAINNSYRDFKSVVNSDDASALQKTISKSSALYSSMFPSIEDNGSYKDYVKFISDIKTEDIRGYSDFLFYSSFKKGDYDKCVKLIEMAQVSENLDACAGVIVALDYELKTDALSVLKPLYHDDSERRMRYIESSKNALVNWGKSSSPVEIVKNTLNRSAKEIRELDKYFGGALSSMSIFAKDVNEMDLRGYTKKNSEALNSFLEYHTSVPFYLSRQSVVQFTDKEKFCMSIRSSDEIQELRKQINKELNEFKCISSQGLLKAFGSISKTLKDAMISINPPTIGRLSIDNLSAISKDFDVSGRNLETLRMSMLHGVINKIEQDFSHEQKLLEQLKDLSNKISYHSICRNGTRDESIEKYHAEKISRGMDTIGGIVYKEQFKDFPIAIPTAHFNGIANLVETLDKIVPQKNESLLENAGESIEEKKDVTLEDVKNARDASHEKEKECDVENKEPTNQEPDTTNDNVFSEPTLDEYDGAQVGL